MQESTQRQSEGSSLGISVDSSINTASADSATIRSAVRASVDGLTETPHTRRIGKERNSSESQQSERDKKGKRMQKMLKNQVHKQQARINTISKKIGHGVSKGTINRNRSNSAPGMPGNPLIRCISNNFCTLQTFNRCWLERVLIKPHLFTLEGESRLVQGLLDQNDAQSLLSHHYHLRPSLPLYRKLHIAFGALEKEGY